MTVEEGVRVTSAEVNGFTLADVRFPPDLVQDTHEPELPYLALVLDGSLAKSFRARTIELDKASGVIMPVGAAHGARFGPKGARVMIVKPKTGSGPLAGCLERLVELRARGFSWLAWRLAAELRASDTAAPLAAEGLALEILAATKYVADSDLPALAEAGIELVGENRAQDMLRKQEQHGELFTWDFIGAIQSRKLKDIAPNVRLIHSIASESALRRLEQHPAREVLIQVNVAGEDSKEGIDPSELGSYIEACPSPVTGLMTMPPFVERADWASVPSSVAVLHPGGDEQRDAGWPIDSLVQHRGHLRPTKIGATHHLQDGRSNERLEAHERRSRCRREAEVRLAFDLSELQGVSRIGGDPE